MPALEVKEMRRTWTERYGKVDEGGRGKKRKAREVPTKRYTKMAPRRQEGKKKRDNGINKEGRHIHVNLRWR